MPDTVNLAAEYAAPETVAPATATTNNSVDLTAEFEQPPSHERTAVINDSVEKARRFKAAVASGDIEQDTVQAVGLLDEWFGRGRFEFGKISEAVGKDPGLQGINKPLIELPLAKEGQTIPIPSPAGTVQVRLPILTGAYNGIAPVVSGLTSPLNISLLGTFGALARVAQGIGRAADIARTALRVAQTGFAAEMAKGAGEAAGAASVPDGKSTQQETADVVGALAQSAMAALAALAAHGAAKSPEPAVKGPPENPNAVAEAMPPPVEPVNIGDRSGRPTGAAEEAIVAEMKRNVDEHLAAQKPAPVVEQPPVTPAVEQPKLAEEFTPPAADSEAHAVITEELAKNETPPAEPETPIAEMTPPEGGATGIKNAIVDQERSDRGLPPAMEPAAKEFGTSWSEALKEVEKNPNAGAELVTEVLDKPRPLTDTENALLLHRQIEVQNQFDKVTNRLAEGDVDATPEQRASDSAQLAKLSDDLMDIYNAGKLVGTEQGRGLASRKMLANEDYSLAKMTTLRRAVNDGKALTPEQSAEVKALNEKISATQKAFDEYVAKAEEKMKGLEKKRPGTSNTDQNVVSRYIADRADAARARISQRLQKVAGASLVEGENVGDFFSKENLDDLATVGADYLAKGIAKSVEWGEAMVKEFGEKVRPHLDELFKRAQAIKASVPTDPKELARLKSFKTRTATSTEKLEARTEAGDFATKPRTPLALDEEAQRLKADNERAKIEFQTALIKDRLANRTSAEKAQDTLVKWRRGFLLSGPSTLAKLTGAAFLRVVTTPIEELAGAAIGTVAPDLMAKAPRHGGLNVNAEAKAITAIFTKGMSEAYKTLTTGKSNSDVLYGRTPGGNVRPSDVIPQTLIDFFGNLHGALKAPVKASEFARSFEKRVAYAIKNGVDVSDPAVQQAISVAAYKDANRAIFMQDNVVSKMINTALSAGENLKIEGRRTATGKAISTGLRLLLPIVKVPTNIVAEAVEYTTGSVTGSIQLAKAMHKGMDGLSEDQADQIARQLKKGSLGAAALLIGYFGHKNFGGFYQQGEKRDKNDVAPGAARIANTDIGRSLIHSSLVETMQLGATIGRLMDQKIKNKNETMMDSIGLGTLGLLEELPFVRTPIEMGKLFDKNERQYVKGELVKGIVVPQAVSQAAQFFDKDAKGNPVKRNPKTVLEHVETGVPGLRETVPAKGGLPLIPPPDEAKEVSLPSGKKVRVRSKK